MSDGVDNLVLELLRGMRADMARVADRQDTMGAEPLIIRQHMAGLVGSQTLNDAEIAGLKVRPDRIEHRLELID